MADETEIYDKKRFLSLTIKSWYYYCDYPEDHQQETTNPFLLEGKAPFTNSREDWIKEATDTIIERLTKAMIDEFSSKGIKNPAGENCETGSIDWNYEIIDARFEFESGCGLTSSDKANIEVMLKEIRDNIDNIDYVAELRKDIDKILERKGCTRDDINTLIRRYGVQKVF